MSVAAANPQCLQDPKPLYTLQGFSEGAVNIQFSVWVKCEQFLVVTNALQEEIKIAFERNGICLPSAKQTVQFETSEKPLSVRIVEGHEKL